MKSLLIVGFLIASFFFTLHRLLLHTISQNIGFVCGSWLISKLMEWSHWKSLSCLLLAGTTPGFVCSLSLIRTFVQLSSLYMKKSACLRILCSAFISDWSSRQLYICCCSLHSSTAGCFSTEMVQFVDLDPFIPNLKFFLLHGGSCSFVEMFVYVQNTCVCINNTFIVGWSVNVWLWETAWNASTCDSGPVKPNVNERNRCIWLHCIQIWIEFCQIVCLWKTFLIIILSLVNKTIVCMLACSCM
jgi:hypothetical protein